MGPVRYREQTTTLETRIVCGFFYIPQGYHHRRVVRPGPMVYCPY